MLQPAPAEQDFFWDDLLEYIEERRVIRVVGAELLTLSDGAGGCGPLMTVVASQLAARLRVPADDCTGTDALHTVVYRYWSAADRATRSIAPGLKITPAQLDGLAAETQDATEPAL